MDWAADDSVGATDLALFPEPTASSLIARKEELLRTGEPQKHELTLDHGGATRFFDLYIQPDCDESGAVVGLLTSIIDVSDHRRTEAIRKTLLREVTHRSKNLLAIVISLAAQTSRTARSIDDFLERFNGRLQSMARSQDLVTDANWRGAQLSELIDTQVTPLGAEDARPIDLEGHDYYLKPNAALYVGLALHELAVNSVQNGALASSNGTISVSTNRLSNGREGEIDEPAISIVWNEYGEQGVGGPDTEEFGYMLLARLVPAAVGGTAKLSIDDRTFRYEVTLMRREFE